MILRDQYNYKVNGIRVVDGDTVDMVLDVGFRHTMEDRFRLYGPDRNSPVGMNAPELNTPEGKIARDSLRDFILKIQNSGSSLRALTKKDGREKYGRWLVVLVVMNENGEVTLNVNQWMIDSGYAALKEY